MITPKYSENLVVAEAATYFMDFVKQEKLSPIDATVRLHAMLKSLTDECNRRLTYYFRETIDER